MITHRLLSGDCVDAYTDRCRSNIHALMSHPNLTCSLAYKLTDTNTRSFTTLSHKHLFFSKICDFHRWCVALQGFNTSQSGTQRIHLCHRRAGCTAFHRTAVFALVFSHNKTKTNETRKHLHMSVKNATFPCRSWCGSRQSESDCALRFDHNAEHRSRGSMTDGQNLWHF